MQQRRGYGFSGLTEPATKLIQSVSTAVGVLYEPTKIRRISSANYDAKIIATKADIEAEDIALRAAHRIAIQEIRNQENIERILSESMRIIDTAEIYNENVDSDFIINYL